MIEINLLPGARKRKRRSGGGFAFKLPENLPALDRMVLFIVAAWIIAPAVGGWMYFGVKGEQRDVEAALVQAVADSTRFAGLIQTQQRLRARQDTIAQKLAIIQEIDAGRYIWPHVMDEVSRVLPSFTWLRRMDQVQGGMAPQFLIEGRAGTVPAITSFMNGLEASPFIREVEILTSEQAAVDNDPNRVVHNFVLRARYQRPSLEDIETVPLFEGAAEDSLLGAGTGGGNGTDS